jgi:hypothetical protein
MRVLSILQSVVVLKTATELGVQQAILNRDEHPITTLLMGSAMPTSDSQGSCCSLSASTQSSFCLGTLTVHPTLSRTQRTS